MKSKMHWLQLSLIIISYCAVIEFLTLSALKKPFVFPKAFYVVFNLNYV